MGKSEQLGMTITASQTLFQDGALINEDALMKDEIDTKVVGKFCGEDDKIMAGKPCANCTCGRKE